MIGLIQIYHRLPFIPGRSRWPLRTDQEFPVASAAIFPHSFVALLEEREEGVRVQNFYIQIRTFAAQGGQGL